MLDFLQLPVVRLLIYTLAVFRGSYMLWWENGPGHVFEQLRAAAGVRYDASTDSRYVEQGAFFGELLNCPLCVSVWLTLLALPAIFNPSIVDLIALALAISTVCMFLFQISEALE